MSGQKITISNGKLNVPNNPVIPFIEGDGTGPDIWRASVRVFDAEGKLKSRAAGEFGIGVLTAALEKMFATAKSAAA